MAATLEKLFSPDVFEKKVTSAAVAALTRPKMRRLLKAQMSKHMVIAIALSCLSGLTFKLTVADPRKKKYAEFYRTYDAEKACDTMRRKGLFQSC